MHSAFNFICKIRTAADWLGIDWHGILQHCSAAASNLAVHCVTACGHRGTFVMQLSAAPSSSQLGKHSSTLHCFTPALPSLRAGGVRAEATTHTTWANVKDGPWTLALDQLNGFPCNQGILNEFLFKEDLNHTHLAIKTKTENCTDCNEPNCIKNIINDVP